MGQGFTYTDPGGQTGWEMITYEQDEDLIMWGLEDYLEEMIGKIILGREKCPWG